MRHRSANVSETPLVSDHVIVSLLLLGVSVLTTTTAASTTTVTTTVTAAATATTFSFYLTSQLLQSYSRLGCCSEVNFLQIV